MADNVKVDEGSGPAIATDEVGGAQHQQVKVEFGANGTATPVSSAAPLPVSDEEAIEILTALGSLLSTIDADTGNLGAIKTAVEVLDNAISGSEMQVDVVASLPAGTNAIGKLAANSGVDIGDVDVTSISAGTNLIGDVGLRPRTTGGLSIHKNLDVDESEDAVKESAGQVYFIRYDNRATAERFLKLYNATPGSVTVGTTVPVMTIPLAKESAGHVPIPQGLAFSTAITVAATTGLADNDTGAPGVNEVVVTIGYA